MDWKTVLYDFVRQRNQMALDYSVGRVESFLLHEDYLHAESLRQQRISHSHKQRSLRPTRRETRLTLVHTHERGDEVTVVVELRSFFEYTQDHKTFLESRVEREQIGLTQVYGKWMVRKVWPDVSEKYKHIPQVHVPHKINEENTMGTRFGTKPYLNHLILSSREAYSTAKKASIPYDRQKTRVYAEKWWNSANPIYANFEQDDCTNFVSQCLVAGGAPMHYTGKRDFGWWYRGRSGSEELWSFSWSVADSLRRFLTTANHAGWQGQVVDSPELLTIGDVISYDWDGDGRFQHTTVVTGFENGFPLVHAHTVNSRNRYWDYRDSYVWSEKTKYRFIQMPDRFYLNGN